MVVRPFRQCQGCIILYLFVLTCKICSGLHTAPCDYPGSLLLAVGLVAVKQMELTFSESAQEYVETDVMYFTRPMTGAVRVLVAVKDIYNKDDNRLCLRSFDNFDPCCSNGNSDACTSYKHPTEQCMKSPIGGAHSTQQVQSSGLMGYADGCSFDGQITKWNLTAVDNETLLHTWLSDREVKLCDSPSRRYIRREVITYKVVQGCLMGAKAQGCEPGVATCKPCAEGNVEVRKAVPVLTGRGDVYRTLTYCRPRTQPCDLGDANFIGCPAATEAQGYNSSARTVNCSLCAPHTINGAYPDQWSGSGLKVKCQACGDYTEAPGQGNTECKGCKAGQYATRKTPPINCKDCPPGTFTNLANQKSCTKCPQYFFQDKAGQTACKRCPTEWRCLVPANLLDKWQYTPFRWDASGNPQCVTLDGKECWKDTAVPCSKKLQMLADMMKQGKFKSLTCGEQHKKIWGYTGYDNINHWCAIAKRVFMIPGKPDIGAASCGAAATNMTLPQPVKTFLPAATSCDCPKVQSCSQVCSLG